MEKKLKAGDVIEFNGKRYRAEREVEKGTCIGCDLFDAGKVICGSGVPRCIPFIFKEVKDVLRRLGLGVVKVEGDNVTFRIVTQTHRGGDFCQQIEPEIFKASNGLELRSIGMPMWGSNDSTLFCCGDRYDSDNNKLTCTATEFARISEAVSEYNATNGKGYKKTWPQTGDDYFYILENGALYSRPFYGDKYDCAMQGYGNFFRTEEEALSAAEKVKALLKELAAK
nr:MAG TPA: hypothetical protein [Caudoviricetes sp.]